MSESSRSVPMPMWMGIIVVLLLLLNLIFLFIGKSEKPGSGPITTSDEVKRIITRDNMDYALVISKDGLVVPVTAEGEDAVRCYPPGQGENVCSYFRKEGIEARNIEAASVAKYNYQFNPTCIMYVYMGQGGTYYYVDPTDPNCMGG